MQNHVIARPLRVSEMIEIYNAAIGQTYKVHGHTDYQVPNKRTKKNNLFLYLLKF